MREVRSRAAVSVALGLIEHKYELVRAYLDSPPAQLVVVHAA